MLRFYGIIVKGDKRFPKSRMVESEYLWITERQHQKLWASQESPETRGKVFRVNSRCFRLTDVDFEDEFDLDDKSIRWQLASSFNIRKNFYFFEELKSEGVDIEPYVSKGLAEIKRLEGGDNGKV